MQEYRNNCINSIYIIYSWKKKIMKNIECKDKILKEDFADISTSFCVEVLSCIDEYVTIHVLYRSVHRRAVLHNLTQHTSQPNVTYVGPT